MVAMRMMMTVIMPNLMAMIEGKTTFDAFRPMHCNVEINKVDSSGDNDNGGDYDKDEDNAKFSCDDDSTPLFTPLEDQMIDCIDHSLGQESKYQIKQHNHLCEEKKTSHILHK